MHAWDPASQVVDTDDKSGSWLQSGLALATVDIGNVNQPSFLSLKFPCPAFRIENQSVNKITLLK